MKYLKYLISLSLIIFPSILLSQSTRTNLQELPFEKLKELFIKNENHKNEQLKYASAYFNKAKQVNIPIEKARGLYLLALLKDGDEAIKLLDSAIYYSKNLNDTKFPAYAYSKKAYQLKNKFLYREAIDNFLIAEKLAKKNNLDFYYKVKFSIALLRSEELGQVHEALELYKECFNYYIKKNIRSPKYYYSYQDVIFALADAYKSLHQTDSTSYYNNLGYRESKSFNDFEYNALFVLNEGANLTLKKNYIAALDSINKALPKIIFYKNTSNILASYYYLGQTYNGLGNKKEAAKNFIKVDSIYTITKRITPEFTHGYPYLISYFKNKDDKANQLKYLTKYMFIDSLLQNNYKELTKKLRNEYDTPNLILEKEKLISSLKKDKVKSNWGITILLLVALLAIVFGIYQYYLQKKQRIGFEKIMHNEFETVEINNTKNEKNKIDFKTKNDIGINEDVIFQILEKFEKFEKEKHFLESGITLQSLSIIFDTNIKYMSKIVNIYKQKTFVQYINDLRIEYAIKLLKEDNKLRKYTIQALANEFGFNNSESFSTAFHKKTGIKPAYFIKQLETSTTANT